MRTPFVRIEVQHWAEKDIWQVFLLCWSGHWAELRRRRDGAALLPTRASALLVARGWARQLQSMPIWVEGEPLE